MAIGRKGIDKHGGWIPESELTGSVVVGIGVVEVMPPFSHGQDGCHCALGRWNRLVWAHSPEMGYAVDTPGRVEEKDPSKDSEIKIGVP